jgi:F-type H+-transporting ATPase subunit delta
MAETITIARPYARAAFEQAHATGELNRWSNLLQVAAFIAADPSMRSLLENPKLSAQEKSNLMLDLCGEVLKDDIPEAGRNFISLLADNRRLTVLPHITAIFETLRTEAEKTIQAQLVTAFTITDTQRKKIAKALKAKLKRNVELECTVDESLIGGAMIRAGDLVIDASVQGQLERLAAALRH